MSEVLYLHQVAEVLGMTESAFRGQLHRDKERVDKAVPQPFRKVGKRLMWRRRDVYAWLEGESVPEQPQSKRRPGRPTKADKMLGLA